VDRYYVGKEFLYASTDSMKFAAESEKLGGDGIEVYHDGIKTTKAEASTTLSFGEIFPNAQEGREYTLTFDHDADFACICGYSSGDTVHVTSAVLTAAVSFAAWVVEAEGEAGTGCPAKFTNIALTYRSPKNYFLYLPDAGMDDTDYTVSWERDGDELVVTSIKFKEAPERLANITIASDVVPTKFATVGDMRDLLTGNPDMGGNDSALAAINGCTLITEFDGRVFLSGNPNLPNTVFYTQRDATGLNNPFYIGAYNYLNDGTDGTPITGMISTATMLIVLKGDSPQGSTLYYHQAVNNDSEDKVIADLQPRLYPRTSGVAGEGCTGVAVNFLDDACFVSRKGLEAVGREAVNLERTLTHRSVYVDSLLREEDLYNMAYAEWDGYLCLLAPSGRMYLADGRKRTSHKHYGYQYEWFIWDGIGVWEGQTDRYFYVNDGAGGKAGEYDIAVREGYAEGEVTTIENKKYIIADGYAFPVDTDGEKHGGEFSPATCLLSVGGRLYFGCENGAVCVFNTDLVDGAIPAEKYTRNGRRYMAQISTKSDNCGAPYAEKTTERGTVVIKAKAFPSAKVRVMVRTDRDIWRQCDEVYLGVTDFGNMDFGTFKFGNVDETIAPVRENKRRWVEKQIGLEAECYKSPVGIINITYGYRITGKVRRR
jgi:hypothetical protein